MRSALHFILAGETYISPSLLKGEVNANVRKEVPRAWATGGDFFLTPRQTEILHLMTQGLPNKSIANRLNCSDGTVKLHVSAILRALQVHNRTEAVQLVARMGV